MDTYLAAIVAFEVLLALIMVAVIIAAARARRELQRELSRAVGKASHVRGGLRRPIVFSDGSPAKARANQKAKYKNEIKAKAAEKREARDTLLRLAVERLDEAVCAVDRYQAIYPKATLPDGMSCLVSQLNAARIIAHVWAGTDAEELAVATHAMLNDAVDVVSVIRTLTAEATRSN